MTCPHDKTAKHLLQNGCTFYLLEQLVKVHPRMRDLNVTECELDTLHVTIYIDNVRYGIATQSKDVQYELGVCNSVLKTLLGN